MGCLAQPAAFSHLELQGLKDTILNEPAYQEEEELVEDEEKNGEACAELIEFLNMLLFAIYVTQSEVVVSFADFRTKLHSYVDTEKVRATASDDSVIKAGMQPGTITASTSASDRGAENTNTVCYRCGQRGDKARTCILKQ